MNQKMYSSICAIVFLVVALGHLIRVFAGWDVHVASWAVPMWMSVLGLIAAGCLSAFGFILASRSRTTD
jgi:Mn2+/Fe2+ NRAMP family transporter